MESINFTYWLQGFFEISDSKTLNEKQVQIIKDHLDLVFTKVTPDRNGMVKKNDLTIEKIKNEFNKASEERHKMIFPSESDFAQKICESEKPHRNGPVLYC